MCWIFRDVLARRCERVYINRGDKLINFYPFGVTLEKHELQ